MFTSTTRPKATTHKARKWSLRKRDERGLTTLEWLLLVAAAAGIAALAIVLVQGVVDDTAEDIRGSSARGQAALVAGQAIIDEAKADLDIANFGTGNTYVLTTDYIQYFDSKCRRLGITYADAGITVTAQFALAGATTATPATLATAAALPIWNTASSVATAYCYVNIPG